MNETMLDEICQEFKNNTNKDIKDLDLFTMETEVLKFVMNLGKNMINKLFKDYGTGHQGEIVEKKTKNTSTKGIE